MISIYPLLNSSSYKVVSDSNNKTIGTFIQDVDGFYYFEAISTGLWSDYALKAISDKLFELNKPWANQINKDFKKGKI